MALSSLRITSRALAFSFRPWRWVVASLTLWTTQLLLWIAADTALVRVLKDGYIRWEICAFLALSSVLVVVGLCGPVLLWALSGNPLRDLPRAWTQAPSLALSNLLTAVGTAICALPQFALIGYLAGSHTSNQLLQRYTGSMLISIPSAIAMSLCIYSGILVVVRLGAGSSRDGSGASLLRQTWMIQSWAITAIFSRPRQTLVIAGTANVICLTCFVLWGLLFPHAWIGAPSLHHVLVHGAQASLMWIGIACLSRSLWEAVQTGRLKVHRSM